MIPYYPCYFNTAVTYAVINSFDLIFFLQVHLLPHKVFHWWHLLKKSLMENFIFLCRDKWDIGNIIVGWIYICYTTERNWRGEGGEISPVVFWKLKKCPDFARNCPWLILCRVFLLRAVNEMFIEGPLSQETSPAMKNSWLGSSSSGKI